jgi:hypothetical protein
VWCWDRNQGQGRVHWYVVAIGQGVSHRRSGIGWWGEQVRWTGDQNVHREHRKVVASDSDSLCCLYLLG